MPQRLACHGGKARSKQLLRNKSANSVAAVLSYWDGNIPCLHLGVQCEERHCQWKWATSNAAYLSVDLLCCDLQRYWKRVPVKTSPEGAWLWPSSRLSDCKHWPLRVTIVPVTVKRNPSVPETSRAGTAPLLQVALVFSFRICQLWWGKEQAAVMS